MQGILRHINFDGGSASISPFMVKLPTEHNSGLIKQASSGLWNGADLDHVTVVPPTPHLLPNIASFSLRSPVFNVSVVKCILVASPGFVKDQFMAYLFREAVRQDSKILLENRPKFMLVHSSSGHKYSLKGREHVLITLQCIITMHY